MSRIGPNPTSRRLTRLEDSGEVISGNTDTHHAQPMWLDDHDDSHDFDRARSMDERPPLDEDPLIHM